jgi:putative ATPase
MTAVTTLTKDPTHLFEKYRPRSVAAAILLPKDREALNSFIANGRAPHLLLVGPPGVGKTSVATALAHDMDWTVMRKNAAAYVDIDAVRNEIAMFAVPQAVLPFLDDGRHHCILLDEADHIPTKAQAALRGVMEEAASTGHANFILTANDGTKIDPAIRSRCTVFDWSYAEAAKREIIKSACRERIAQILLAEGFEPDQEVIEQLLDKHFPDLRAILNDIQRHSPPA